MDERITEIGLEFENDAGWAAIQERDDGGFEYTVLIIENSFYDGGVLYPIDDISAPEALKAVLEDLGVEYEKTDPITYYEAIGSIEAWQEENKIET